MRKAWLISSTLAFLSSSTVRSTRETVEVGTLTAMPVSFPATSGRTRPTALAAPVVVGIMDMAAALARRMSEWGRSRMRWSLV